jgi:rhomboid protease GluP
MPLYRRYNYKSATFILIVINVVVYLVQTILKYASVPTYNYMLIYAGISQWGLSHGLLYQPLTALFLHGNILHIAFNMWALFQLGNIVENTYGMKKYLLFYFGTGIVGNLFAVLFTPSVTIGASTAVFGLVGVLFALGLRKDTPIHLKSITGFSLLPIIFINIIFGLTNSGISNAAHIGGLIIGSIMGYFIAYNSKIRRNPKVKYAPVNKNNSDKEKKQQLGKQIIMKYGPQLYKLKDDFSVEKDEKKKLILGNLRKDLVAINDYSLSVAILNNLFTKNLITRRELDSLKKWI